MWRPNDIEIKITAWRFFSSGCTVTISIERVRGHTPYFMVLNGLSSNFEWVALAKKITLKIFVLKRIGGKK